MAGWTDIAASSTDVDSPITTELMTALADNPVALAEGASGAPRVYPLLIVKDVKISGTAAGTFSSGAWRTRDLNTVDRNEISGAVLASNQITLPAGRYTVEAYATAADGGSGTLHQAILYDTTGAAELVVGLSSVHGAAGGSVAHVCGEFTLSTESLLELRHRISTSGKFGEPSGWTDEVYAVVNIRRIAPS